jgi:polysaccharide deacetylase 2 family uncharacterized protein YibQ
MAVKRNKQKSTNKTKPRGKREARGGATNSPPKTSRWSRLPKFKAILLGLLMGFTPLAVFWAWGSEQTKLSVEVPSPELELQRVQVPTPVSLVQGPSPEQTTVKKKVVLVLDDAGYHVEHLKKFLELPFPFAVAIIPFLPESSLSLELVKQAKKIPMLHMPMQPLGNQNPGEGALMVDDDDGTIIDKLQRALDSLPGVVGVNNHMGSLLTSNKEKMRVVLNYLASRNLFYVDSLTSAGSVALELAQELNHPLLQRDIFLDHEESQSYREHALGMAKDRLLSKDYVVLIGHVQTPSLIDQLLQFYHQNSESIEFVDPREILR